MFAFTLTLWTLTVHVFTAARAAGTGQPHVIGSLMPIVAAPGDDVILPCHLEPFMNVEALTVEWSKPDLKPDPLDRLSRVEYVHLYRDRREVPDMKIQSYVKRTALFTDRLKHGNISLKILNVTVEDEGRYKCFIPKLNSPFKDSIVQLVVDPNLKETTTTETTLHPRTLQPPEPKNETNLTGGRSHLALLLVAVFWVVLVLGGGVGGYLFHRHKHHQQNLVKYDAASHTI
ncbi:myelin-oligodendrocyte glycoprotein-like isoform X2 [Larimichthys crocea]|uniref:myelin-oligodendrocyte glycoprotein-like isoform X2 n=2 Tax=Larimichthys crocea TaxID=215358 RepID=UPI000F6015BD|nr:myelin-oligodendrocyte glycoprotein-like isoform X2 [Larimichthys crocea]